MSKRIPRLWQPGNGRIREFLTDFWVRFEETPKVGLSRLPPNAACFEVDPRMSRYDVRQYLEKIYNLPVRDVRTRNVMGKMLWDNPESHRYRQALFKEPDQKFATVFFKRGTVIDHQPFTETAEQKHLQKQLELIEKQTEAQLHNERFANRNRGGVGQILD